ncbi:MAG: ATP-dependent RNA helicase, partial [Planctomycetaceae bacterium]|nr:ATP-dependent RNA helicase [Planctomycetaceae bacterium]
MLERLPVDDVLPHLTDALHSADCAVLKADVGAGKTTRVPPALLAGLDAGGRSSGTVIVLEPRRIAARSAARRMAQERDESVGETVGYQVRFDHCFSPRTRILVVTEGILLRRLLDDPFLEGISAVVFDEFHERRLDSDVALAMTRRVQQSVRPDLRIVVMSATIAAQPIAEWLGNCSVIESEGRRFPVRIEYQSTGPRDPISRIAMQGVRSVIDRTDGDVLVFLPGVGEILRTQSELRQLLNSSEWDVLTLFGDMPPEEQDRVLQPGPRRRIILSTNVAETSLTIQGITAVVDTGFVRQMQFDTSVGLDRLELTRISKASADQRAGRAGRTQPGLCVRMWPEASHRVRSEYESAEIHRVDLSGTVLRLLAWGETEISSFPWFESPESSAVEHSLQLLELLQATNQGMITETGRRLSLLPVAPRLGRMLLETAGAGCLKRGALAAALLSERDPFLKWGSSGSGHRLTPSDRRPPDVHTWSRGDSDSDLLDRIRVLERHATSTEAAVQPMPGQVNEAAARNIHRVARQLMSLVPSDQTRNAHPTPGDTADTAFLQSLVAAFPDRVAKRREAGS